MKVSIITAFYHGNSYMQQYVDCVRENQKHLLPEDELEAIIVNDSPEEAVQLPTDGADCNIWVVDLSQNGGIQNARVQGLQACNGEYVMFLDQDDLLEKDAIAKLLQRLKEWQKTMEEANSSLPFVKDTGLECLMMHPVIVANAALEQADGSRLLWYRSAYHKGKIGDLKTYLKVGVQIISPGQCLVPKDLIPKTWKTRICKKNGADDYYLWLLFLARRIPFLYVDEPLYLHSHTGKNLSADTKKMDDSTYEFLEYVKEDGVLEDKSIACLRRMTSYKQQFRTGGLWKKLWLTARNLDIFLANLWFKMKTKTPYGFNR